MSSSQSGPTRNPLKLVVIGSNGKVSRTNVVGDTSTRIVDSKESPSNFGDVTKSSFIHSARSKSKSVKLVKCTECNESYDQSCYSINQWTKPSPKCRGCIEGFEIVLENKKEKR